MKTNLSLNLLYIYRELQSRADSGMQGMFADSVAKYLLIQMGLTIDQVDEGERLFLQQLESDNLSDFGDVLVRTSRFLKSDEWLRSFMVSSLGAVVVAQNGDVISDAQRDLINVFQELFDMKPSEFRSALGKGFEWGIALTNAAAEYSNDRRNQS